MPIFEHEGKKYNVSDEHIDSFIREFPNATTIQERGGKKYRVRSADYKSFLSEQQSPGSDASRTETASTPVAAAPETPVTPTPAPEPPAPAVEQPQQPAQPQEQPLTEQDKMRMTAQLNGMMRDTQRMTEQFNTRMADMQEYVEKGMLSGGQTVESGFRFNPASGKMEKTFITPLGNRYADKGAADMESFRYRQAADMSVGGQLRKARQRLQDVEQRLDERGRELLEEHERNQPGGFARFVRDMGEAMAGDRMGGATGRTPEDEVEFQTDEQYQSLRLQQRQIEEQIQQLENYRQKEQNGERFWHDFGRNTWQAIYDIDAWDFGKNALRDSQTRLQLAGKAQRGEQLSDEEANALYEMYMNDNVMQQFGDLGRGAKWGNIAGGSLSFMKDFLITGGFSGITTKMPTKMATSVATRAAKKLSLDATESLGVKVAEQGLFKAVRSGGKGFVSRLVAEQGIGGTAGILTTRALGVTAEDLLIRAPLMVATVQGQNTAAEIIDTKLGPVIYDEEAGELRFADDTSWGEAVWETGADRVIENFSEMWGAHLPGMADVTKAFGARNLTAAILRSTRPGAGTVMSKTAEFLSRAGINGYLVEVGEEYYGQLWRTMLNLDSAKDAQGNNLFGSGEFHGDIWGGMALSIGLTGGGTMAVNYAGEGVERGLNAARYKHLMHQLGKSDVRASEMLTPEVWEGMRLVIDASDNADMGNLAAQVMADTEMTDEQKTAVMDYMERTMIVRGHNLGEYVRRRNGETPNPDADEIDQSYIDGYNSSSAQEMNDAKNLYDVQRAKLEKIFGMTEGWLRQIDDDPLGSLQFINRSDNWTEEERNTVLDYINAKQVYEGMMQRVRDDIDGRIEQSNTMIDARVNNGSGMIQGATMKQDDRKVYVVRGSVVPYEDGTGVDLSASDESIIVRDAETGKLEQVSPDAILSIDEAQDPAEQKEIAAQTIREQYAREAADKIDGVASFNPGDTYTVTGEDGQQAQVTIAANEQGVVDNGDGTVNVTDGTNVFPMQKDLIQEQVDAQNLQRVTEFELQREAENAAAEQAQWEANKPQYTLNDRVTLQDENGNVYHGQIADHIEADDVFVVDVDSPIDGKYAPSLTREQLDGMVVEYNGNAVKKPTVRTTPQAEVAPEAPVEQPVQSEAAEAPVTPATETTETQAVETAPAVTEEAAAPQVSALERIPKDEQGQPLYEQADSDTAFDAIMEQADGDEAMAQSVAAAMLADKEAELKKIEKAKPKGGVSVAEKIAAERERKAAVEQAKQNVAIWKRIADTPARRKAAIEAERRRQAEEAAAQRRAEEERLKAEREEQERIKREALNGVPDIVNDTPQNARARGYRRVNGYKIDRQEPVQTLPGKEVQVKFSDDTTTKGNVVLIDASQLQPSHLGGQRNPLHFIDEAQPKERNDGVSVMSAEKIAGRIRPEEITSSVTAFTGAPTVNARGEVIQGNNRSAALREMWRSYPEQAALYKQYLKDHAAEFGLNAADIDAMQQPVLVNMLDVTDDDAITLGQFVAQDTESGGVERIKPKNAVHKMGKDMRSFVNILLRSSDDEVSFAELLDSNGAEVLKWMNHRGYITPTQHRSAFDSKGNLTGEAKNDIKGIMYQSIFKGGSTLLEEMFGQMPAKAQKAILATAWRDYDSPNSERMIEEIQNSIMAYSDLMLYDDFAKAKNFKEARQAVENWKRQYQIDDATGESYLPTDKFSNFALHLATMYKGESQNLIQGTFNRLYDLIQGTQEATIFDQQPDNTPRSLVEAIKEELNIDYNGKQRSNVLAGDSSASQRGEQGSSGTPASGERVPDRTAASDNTGGTDGDSGRSGTPGEIGSNQSQEEVPSRSAARVQEAQERLSDDEVDALMSLMESAAVETPILELNPQNWLEQFGEDGMVNTPIARVKMGANQIAKLFEKGRSEQFGMIKPTLETPLVVIEVPSEASNGDTERPTSLLYVKTFLGKNGEKIYYFKSVTVSKEGYEVNISSHYDRPKRIKEALKNGKLLYRFDGGAQTEHRPADVSVTTSQEGVQGTSASKGSDNSSNTSELGGENAEEMEEKPFAVQQSKRGDVELYRARKRNGGVTTTRVVAIRNGQEVGLATRRMPMPDGLVAVDIPEGVEILGIQELREGDDGRIAATVVVRYGEGVIEKAESRMMTPEQAAQESELGGKIAAAEAEVNRNPTEGQKEAGNYRKGHVQIGTFNVTIENPQGSVRSGTDANGNAWSVTMNNTYGYIRGTEGVDGDHIDVFLSNEIDDWNGRRVFVIDQYNEDGTFDEHKVMLGFNDADEAMSDYLRNYSEGWADNRRIDCTSVNIEDFEKWIDSSHRKTKAFADYKGVKKETSQLEQSQHATDGYTVEPAQYTTKRGKVLDMQLVKFGREFSKEEQRSARELAKGLKGWFSREHGGFLMRSEEDARSLIDAVMDESGEQLADAAPVSLEDVRRTTERMPQESQPASSDKGRQDLTTGSSIDDDAASDAKVRINKSSAKHELNNIIHKYIGKRNTRGFISDLAAALGDTSGKPRQSYYFSFKDASGIEYTLRISNHNVNGENAEEGGKEISIVIKSRRQPNKFVAGNAEITEYVYFKEAIAQGDGQTLALIAQDLSEMLDTGVYADRSGVAIVNTSPISGRNNRNTAKSNSKQAQSNCPTPRQIDVIGLMEEIKEKGEAKLSDHVIEETAQNETEIAQETPKSEQEAKPAVNPSGNKLVTDERYEELKRRMRAKLGQLNVGIDPEVLAIGTEMAVYHIEKGARKFADYAKAMIADLGDVIRPYLKSFYNGARDLPEVIDSGLADEMTAYDEVRTFDTANFDKGHADPFATAETVVAEQELGRQAEAAKQQIITQRNDERRKEDEQTAADTEAVAGQAEVVASQAESDLETARDERQVNAIVEKIDKQVDEVNKQLALLGYYEAEQNDKDYNEAYGYMRNAEKKAVKDANNLAKRLIKDLHIDPATLVDSKGKKLRGYAQANIAPAGGEVTITLPLEQGRELKMYIYLEPTSARRGEDYRVTGLGDNLYIRDIMYRVENPSASGYERYGSNQWMSRDDAADYAHVLQLLRSEAKRYLPAVSTESAVSEQEKPAKQKKAKKNSVSSPMQQPLFDGLFGEAEQETETTEAGQQQEFEPGDKVRLKKDGSEHQILATMRTQDLANGKAPVLDKYMFTDGTSALPDEVESVDAVRTDVEPINTNENGLQRNDEVRSERLSADSDRHEERLSEGSESGSEIQTEESRGIDTGRERGSETVDRTVRPRPASAVAEPKNTRNNHSERGANHAPTSVDARIAANIKAIELAKQLIENGETATLKQMAVLRKYSGWGGLGKAFNERANYTLNGVQYWNEPTPENKRIRELLGEEAYQQAAMSANSSYYTPTYIIDTLWDIAEQMGFEGGNILEGSAGIGNILGQMPGHISERSDIHAIEIDETSGGILSLLYPDAKVDIQGFEKTRIANGSVDLAITNVPFVTGLNVEDTTGDKDLSKKFRNIHDFCIAKNVRKLREGGIGIFISSNGTLDSSKKLRDWVTSEGGADFVGAFRLNNETFGGAPVTSDIIIVRKRVNGRKSPYAIDLSAVAGERTADYDTGETRKVKGQEVPVVKHLAMDYNRYFIEHPENMAGVMRFGFEAGDTYRPTSKGLFPVRGKNQERMLADFAASFSGKEWTEEVSSTEEAAESTFVADTSADGKKIGELYVKDGKLVVANVGGYYPLEVNANKVKGHTKVECFNAYSAIKEALSAVLDYQTNNESDSGLQPLLDRLNKAYDDFVATYGHFNKNTAISFLRNDVDYPNVFSLETFEETGDKSGKKVQKFGKTDVFSKRVVEKEKEPTPTNVKDGIIASVFKYGRIDVPYIAGQLGKSADDVKREIISSGYGFENPVSRQVELSYQYLSGNVREKLRQAQENNENGIYDGNIKALQDVLPMDIPAHLIDFTLGSSWIVPKLYDDYVRERTDVDVRFTAVGGTWFMNVTGYENKEKNRAMGVVSEMFHKTVMGHTLIEAAIQNKTITVSESRRRYDGTTETITDKEATQACAAKIDEIRQDFKDWARQKMQGDADMSARMERIYNDTFNNYVPMSIPDDFVPEYFGGASHKFKMRPHQGRAIVRGTMQPLMLAHEVGTGKTFTLISTAMEMRRLGTARKPMIVVQNATVGQFVASAKELYPKAKILTLEEADRSAEGRKNFYAKIRYNDWDMIVVPQSTFEFIPDSEERQMAFIQDKIEEKMLILEKMREADPRQNNAITRQAEKEIEDLREQLAGITEEATKKRTARDVKKEAVTRQNAEVRAKEMLDRRTDDVENFDDMGIDALLIDEAHEYKHLGFATAMQRGVKGVDSSYSKKSQGVYLKTQAVLEKNNGRNVIFATGTPISNTAAEIWTFMRYLMPADTMKEYGIYYFDDFVRNFGNIQQMLEFTTSGKFKENNRFAGYVNLPELVRIWSGVSDIVLTREAGGVSDKIPAMEGGKAQDIYLPQTRALRSIMKYVKEALEEYEKMSGKEKKENSHMPLTMYGIAKAAAVDARLVQEDAEDDPNSKTNEAVRQTLRSLKETESYKGTVALFADNYQNKHSGFNLYDDIRNKLIAEGVPAEQIVIIRSGMTVKKKLEIFDKVNRGEIRVILGSTFTLGTGVNIQERLHTLIHLDAPNRPMDYTQRNGRILRQGNLHKSMGKPVRILRFGVEDSLDVTAYQRLKTKGAIADSIMNGKEMMTNSMTNRVLEEEEDVFGDTVAQLSGSEYAMLKNNAEKNVRKYESRRKQWEMDQTYIHNAKPKFKALIAQAEKTAKEQREYLVKVREAFPDGKFTEIKAGNKTFTSVDGMADYFKDHNKGINEASKQIKEGKANPGQTRTLSIQLGGFTFVVQTTLTTETTRGSGQLFSEAHRNMVYSCPALGLSEVPVHQSLLRNAVDDIVNNVITGRDFSERAEMAERIAAHNRSELEQIEKREGVPFEFAKELEEARRQLQEYTEAMRKEMEEKEAKYAAMDASVEAAGNLTIDEDDDVLMREDDTMFRIRESEPPTKTGIGYKVFVLRDGKLYPPMVANPGGAETPVGVWLDADAAPIAGQSKTGRNQVKAGGKGTQGGSGRLAYRPGWHLGEIPYALQFNRNDEDGNRELFPANFVWAEVEYADDVNYQDEAMSYGMNKNGKFQHSLAGLPRVPENGSYRYRTNPNPETDPWIITGAMKVNRLLTPTEVDEIVEKAGREPQRRQEGAVSDAEIKNLNAQYELADKMAAAKSRASRKDMAKRVEELAKKLHLDNVEIVTSTSGLQGKKARAKGFFTKSTGKITIVLPNNRNLDDAVQTLLHEAVAHYGLRQLFGKEFDTFLDNVFNNASDEVRRRIVELSKKHNWDFRKATEEYLAGLAESTDFEQARQTSWWQKIKDFFVEMLGKIGFRGVTLTDNELRYVLWRSYENLKGERGVFAEAADIAKQNELGVGEFAEADDELFRDGDPEVHQRTLDRYRYEQRVRSGMFQSMEALQDSMLSLKEAMQAVLGKKTRIEEVEGFENAYLGENRLSSVNKAEADAFAQLLFKPMLDAVARLAKTKAQREELTDYMMAKHGLERNRVMAERDAQNAYDAYKKEHPNGAKTLNDFLDEYRSRDYAGLTALTGYEDVVDAEAEAQQMVADYEAANDTAELWEKVNAVSKAILQKSYDCGMMSKEVFDSISAMYEFYIPLRGFDETTSAEAYAYLNDRHSAFNAPIKKAQGRTSKADDPFANLQSMAESTITQGNRNKLVKQRFLNFALNHPSDLYSISDLWLKYDDVADEWRPVFPDNIELDESPDEVERKMLEFEEHMKQLAEAEPDKYKRGKDAVNIPYRVVESRDLRQHQVVVKRGGRDYVITINGNPRAAQALNGQTNPDNDMSGAIGAVLRAGEKINRQLSAFYTTRNPDFIVSNFLRDMLYTNSMTWIKESPTYALRFHRNYARVNPVRMKILLAKYRNGTLDMSDRTERMFRQFMLNGGETGYANIRDIEQHKNDIRRELKKLAGGKISLRKAWSLLGERFDELNRAVENCARFAAFVTSREMGRSLDRSIYDAKEISVNFNKKGSGAKFFDKAGQTKAGNAAALVSGLGRSGYVFWNAAIQGTANFGRATKRHPAKALTGVAAMFLLGALVAYLGGSGDDDDDKNAYYNLPEYVRRSNILFRVGDSWVSIPLPIEYRAVYGMGELMVSAMSGKEHLTDGELAEAIAGQMTQILPIDFLEGGGGFSAFVPSAAKPIVEAYIMKKSWTGMPIYKDNDFNKEMPEWTKAYSSANKYIVGLSAALNEATGGDPYTKGWLDKKFLGVHWINPAQIEYMLNGYFGGVFGTIDKLSKTGETIFGDREYDPRNILLVNRVLKAGDERTEFRAVNNEYMRLREEYKVLKARLRHYEEDTDNGVFDYAEKIDFLYNSPEYERYEIFEYYRPDLDELYDELKEAHSYGDKDWVKEVEAEMNDLKKEMIQEMNTTRKRK